MKEKLFIAGLGRKNPRQTCSIKNDFKLFNACIFKSSKTYQFSQFYVFTSIPVYNKSVVLQLLPIVPNNHLDSNSMSYVRNLHPDFDDLR